MHQAQRKRFSFTHPEICDRLRLEWLKDSDLKDLPQQDSRNEDYIQGSF